MKLRVLFFLLMPLMLFAAGKPFSIAKNGKAQCVIALAESANKFDKMAAQDLQ